MRKFLTACALVAATAVAQDTNPVVTTPMGLVRGVFNPTSGVSAFKALPFALPPVGQRRFADPAAPVGWSGVRDATHFSPGCMADCPVTSFPHPKFMCAKNVSEDCLYLNVYTPAKSMSQQRLPVIFFIPGGDYQYGSAGCPMYDGQQFAMSQNVVVVTTNYRLGVFGSLYTGTVKGNFHLKDQRMALKWVARNIAAFGGDAGRVTLSGQSAGAASVTAHLASPPSAGLFARAIIVSNPFSLIPQSPPSAMALGEKVLDNLNCTMQGGDLELDCLRSVPADTILRMTPKSNFPITDFKYFLSRMMRFNPVIDPVELPYQPEYAFEHGLFNKVPVMVGTVRNESVQFIHDLANFPVTPVEYDLLLDLAFSPAIAKAVAKVYGKPPASEARDVRPFLSFVATDYIFYCSTRMASKGLTKHVPTYTWLYDYVTPMNKWLFGKNMPYCVDNVCHAQDLSSIFFPYAFMDKPAGMPNPTKTDHQMANVLQTAWGNFAKAGTPNPLPAFSANATSVHFPTFNFAENDVMDYNAPPKQIDGFHDKYCAMWDSFGYNRR